MRGFVKVILIINVALLLLGGILIGVGLLLGGRGSWAFNINPGNTNFNTVEYTDNTMDLDDFDNIKVDVDSMDISLVKGDEYKIEYHCIKDKEPEINVENNILDVKRKTQNNFNFFFMSMDSERLTITVPEDQNVDIVVSSGDINVNAVNVEGKIRTSSGDIDINDSNGESLSVEATSGDISIERCEYEDELKVKQTSGDSKLFEVKADDLSVEGTSGAKIIDNCEAKKAYIKTNSGDKSVSSSEFEDLTVDGTSGDTTVKDSKIGEIKSKTTSGTFEMRSSELDNSNITVTSGDIIIDIKGNVADYGFSCDVTSGDVKINDKKFDDDYESLEEHDKVLNAKTTSGDIKITIQ